MNKILERIIPGAVYKKGFIINGKTYPFYSFSQPNSENSWSDYLTEQLEIPSKNHFIDIYNRKIVFDSIKGKLVQGASYLDAGCSSGYMLENILDKFSEINIIGTDFFSSGLLQCHQRFPDIPLFQMDLVSCSFPDNLFDVVSCLNVIEHIPADASVIKQLFRITKPGGIVVLTVPTMPGLYDMHDEVYSHVRRYKLSELERMMERAGFKIVKANYFGVFMYPVFYAIKKINRMRFSKLSFAEKRQRVFNAIKKTGRCCFLEYACFIEQAIGWKINYPYGFRGYIVASK